MSQAANLHCVKCAKATLVKDGQKAFCCSHCDFVYFHNVAATAGAVIKYDDKVLLLERVEDPAKGKLDFPGGFVDYAESNEQALCRELMEELQLCVSHSTLRYLCSFPNNYAYKNVIYQTLDSFFEVELSSQPQLVLQESEVCNFQWVKPTDINLDDMGFASCKQALTTYIALNKKGMFSHSLS